MIKVNYATFCPLSVVDHQDRQVVSVQYSVSRTQHLYLHVYNHDAVVVKHYDVALSGGEGSLFLLLPATQKTFLAKWTLTDSEGRVVYTTEGVWKGPREWTFHIMLSSHTDIGLHNSQYIQRYNSERFTDMAMELCDKTANDTDCYRYVMEGTWFLNNYLSDRSEQEKKRLLSDYIKKERIGVCAGIAGNTMQTYGLEEMCRSTYERRRLYDMHGIKSETISMIDHNGLPMSMIAPYVNAGYKNVIFAPNQWGPLPSTVWQMNPSIPGAMFNPDASGGGSRVDVSYSSALPMVFYWDNEEGERLLVWASTQYNYGSEIFGLSPRSTYDASTLPKMLRCIAKVLPCMEEKYPYDLWLSACYCDDQEPSLHVLDAIREWNKNWKYPHFQTVGNPDIVFSALRNRFEDEIPTLSGDITGGWYQLPVSTADVLSRKFAADRALPNAEKWATIASLVSDYVYPASDFENAWRYLLLNDEHSYGASGYKGRRVYETWMQHNDWIDKATKIAEAETQNALSNILEQIEIEEDAMVVFNPTLQERTVLVTRQDCCTTEAVPPLGYRVVPCSKMQENKKKTYKVAEATIENRFYRIHMAKNGTMDSIFDKEIGKELIDSASFGANEMVYTKDNHLSFCRNHATSIEITEELYQTKVVVRSTFDALGAAVETRIILPVYEKRIDIENYIDHARDMVNNDRYKRFLYFAFPFAVQNAKRLCHLNGAVAEYAKSVTGHGTDVYMAVNEWCLCQNASYGVALLMKDSQLVEFDHIHPDKTDYSNPGDGSNVFVYAANDWLQMHVPGGSHLNLQFRFSITSYKGDYKAAQLPKCAERYTGPVHAVFSKPHKGKLGKTAEQFLVAETDARLLCLKRADDTQGLIARFYGDSVNLQEVTVAGRKVCAVPNTIDEQPLHKSTHTNGFITYRLGAEEIALACRSSDDLALENLSVGTRETELITHPKAACGENEGQLYLLWGHCRSEHVSHYKLYRSKKADFTADDTTFVADVLAEEYVNVRYVDTELESHTLYYYKVCAVRTDGVKGPMSEIFCAYTREPQEAE